MSGAQYARGLVTLAAAIVILGCEPRSEEADQGMQGPESWSVATTPSVTIGGYDDRPEYTLYDVYGAARLSDGRIAIANRGTSELKFFDSTGVHLLDAGGEGDGPGELRLIHRLVKLPGDTLLVLSRRPGITWYSPSGEYLRSSRVDLFAVPKHPCRHGEGGWSWSVLSDGTLLRLLEDNFAPANCPPTPDGVWRMSGLFGVMSPEGETFDTIAVLPATERLGIRSRVFGHILVLGVGDDRVYVGDTASDVILALSTEGDTLAVLPTPFESAVIPEEAKQTGPIEVTERGQTRFFPGHTNYPDRFPRFGRLVVDALGYLWVMKYPESLGPFVSPRLTLPYLNHVPEGGAEWRVLSPDGDLVAELRTPPSLFVLEIGADYVLGISRDEFDVESVSVHALRRE
jgi:hypothetical protein